MEDNNEDIIVKCIKAFLEKNKNVITPYCIKDGDNVKDKNFEYYIYNECSLQHELGIWLRDNLNQNNNIEYKVYFEKNIYKFLNLNDSKIEEIFPKRNCSDVDNQNKPKCEVDLVIIGKENDEIKEKYAIELKFPINGQYPQQMEKFKEDIKFMRQLNKAWKEEDNTPNDIKMNTYCLTLVNDCNFYKKTGRKSGNTIYREFRCELKNGDKQELIQAEKQINDHDLVIENKIQWNLLKIINDKDENIRYYLIDINTSVEMDK